MKNQPNKPEQSRTPSGNKGNPNLNAGKTGASHDRDATHDRKAGSHRDQDTQNKTAVSQERSGDKTRSPIRNKDH